MHGKMKGTLAFLVKSDAELYNEKTGDISFSKERIPGGEIIRKRKRRTH